MLNRKQEAAELVNVLKLRGVPQSELNSCYDLTDMRVVISKLQRKTLGLPTLVKPSALLGKYADVGVIREVSAPTAALKTDESALVGCSGR